MLNSPELPVDHDTHAAEQVWRATLTEVRRTRLRRRIRKAGMVSLAAALALVVVFRGQPPETGNAVVERPAHIDEPRPEQASLAVLIVRNGTPTLQSLDPDVLGGIELTMSLEPITLDASHIDEMEITSAWTPSPPFLLW